jgi:hypothetical protein
LVTGWLVLIKLCQIDVSIATPLFSLNFIFPVIYGIIVQQNITIIQAFSLVLATISIIMFTIASKRENDDYKSLLS